MHCINCFLFNDQCLEPQKNTFRKVHHIAVKSGNNRGPVVTGKSATFSLTISCFQLYQKQDDINLYYKRLFFIREGRWSFISISGTVSIY